MSSRYPVDGAYHWRAGLFFKRTSACSVHIFSQHPGEDATTVALIPGAEWESILRSLSGG